MALLLGVGFLAGVLTAISPCVLPVLPILLAGGAAGGRRRPRRIPARRQPRPRLRPLRRPDLRLRRGAGGEREPEREGRAAHGRVLARGGGADAARRARRPRAGGALPRCV